MEENTGINTYLLDEYLIVKDKNGNLIPFNNWNSKCSIKNSPYYSYVTFDVEETIKQVRINKTLNDLANRGLIQTF